MKWSSVLALCAAPLALAATIQDIVVRTDGATSGKNSKSGSSVDSGGSSGETVILEEIIIIWVNNGGRSQTSTMGTSTQAASGASATHNVMVGGAAGLVYTPNSISAAVGDMVIFTFMSNNHTATQSSFANPCVKLAGGMDSGFMPNMNNSVIPAPQMAMQVTVATPIWFYCRQKQPAPHCGKGMTFSINPTADKTQAMFEQMAIAQNGTGATAAIVGGSTATATTVSVSTETASSSSSGAGMAQGSGSTSNGACSCSCFCGLGSFPSEVQGLAAFGGMAGSIPMSAAMSV